MVSSWNRTWNRHPSSKTHWLIEAPVLSRKYSVAQDAFLSIHYLQKDDAQRSETTLKAGLHYNMLHGTSCNHFCREWVMLRQLDKLHALNGFGVNTVEHVAWYMGHAPFGDV